MARAAVLAGAALIATPASAQYIGGAPPPLPAAPRAGEVESPSALLARSVRTLAQSPRDFRALISAGRAAVDLGDMQAAIGFFGRADEVRPSDPAPKIGMGAALVATGDANGALAWFFQAQQLGASPAAIGADRGLAQDLLGNQAAAQVDYRAALAGPERDEARRRFALSLGISGNREAAFSMLQPLLMRRDPAAQRIRAFILALVGDVSGASGAIDTAMPGTGARMAGFFRLLPGLSATQKAAAVHLGVFPDPSEIRVASVIPRASPVRADVPRPARRAIASRPVAPNNVTARSSGRRALRDTAIASSRPQFPAPVGRPGRRPIPSPQIIALAPLPAPALPSAVSASPPSPSGTSSPPPAAVAANVPPASVMAGAPSLAAAQPGFTVTAASPPTSTSPALVEIVGPPEGASTTDGLVPISGDRLSGIDRLLAQADELPVPPPSRPKVETVAQATPDPAKARKAAAETRKIAETRKLAEAKKVAERKEAAEAKAAREAIGLAGTNWVQLAGGANADRMGTELRRLAAKSSALKKRGGAVTAGKDYFRLLTGPFASKSEAQAFVNQLAKDGVDGFSWTRTPATLRIEKIPPK